MMTLYHKPVLLSEAIAGLAIVPNGIYVDATFGGGGHARAILEHLSDQGKLFGFDQDLDAQSNRIIDERFEFVASNFSHLKQFLKFYKVDAVDGILADFGVSSHQFDTEARGFSTRANARLDMRMNQSQELDAHQIVNSYSAKELQEIFSTYGELRNSKTLAQRIVAAREEKPINTTGELMAEVRSSIPKVLENKIFAQLFQALRIEVNQELEVLKQFLEQAATVLKPQGRLVCISYHSLEDRLVKRFVQNGNFQGETEKDFYGNSIRPLKNVGKLIVPQGDEIKENSRARSAKMRIAEKL
ncbi:MAG: 16S rRNA (cytosine(1402)-N(4))-methyltransferase RsmH [Flavobacteriaceae bacterium]|jgi:16S rRNA (cytosine1402-N4)-methyltransferase|nr:16S rRNA (cytosine(1402)-N(4))-methyltransferase RsmH [Flavobacteriaceae bacterium]MDA8900493.1 16S rRNA (cytosine(1402)-N(4))-methyltransferase RsmH [Flavobacteriaceae bacterium]